MKVKKINVKRMLAILAIVAATHSKGFTYNIQENALQTEGYAVALSATQDSFDSDHCIMSLIRIKRGTRNTMESDIQMLMKCTD